MGGLSGLLRVPAPRIFCSISLSNCAVTWPGSSPPCHENPQLDVAAHGGVAGVRLALAEEEALGVGHGALGVQRADAPAPCRLPLRQRPQVDGHVGGKLADPRAAMGSYPICPEAGRTSRQRRTCTRRATARRSASAMRGIWYTAKLTMSRACCAASITSSSASSVRRRVISSTSGPVQIRLDPLRGLHGAGGAGGGVQQQRHHRGRKRRAGAAPHIQKVLQRGAKVGLGGGLEQVAPRLLHTPSLSRDWSNSARRSRRGCGRRVASRAASCATRAPGRLTRGPRRRRGCPARRWGRAPSGPGTCCPARRRFRGRRGRRGRPPRAG